MSESMKIELLEDGLDSAISEIRDCLYKAIDAKSRKKKDILIAHANGVASAIYKMTRVVDESTIETQE